MIIDPDVQKVIIVPDRVYAEKSNTRARGTDTEARIIPPGILGRQDRNKSVALVCKKDGTGRTCLPADNTSCIHIDDTDDGHRATQFVHLILWICTRPMRRQPDPGKSRRQRRKPSRRDMVSHNRVFGPS